MTITQVSALPLFWNPNFNFETSNQGTLCFRYSHTKQEWLEYGNLIDSDVMDSSFLIRGSLENKIYVSPQKSTFGGFLKVNNVQSRKEIFLKFLTLLKNEYQVKEFKVTLPPNHLIENENLAFNNFVLSETEISAISEKIVDTNQVIFLNDWSLEKLSKGNRKKLRQCYERNLETKVIGMDHLAEAYEILVKNREKLDSNVSISLVNLIESIRIFPDHYRVFGSFLADKMIATAVTVETTPNNLYVYMWADSIDFRGISPLVAMANSLIQYAHERHYDYLDLGTSSIGGTELAGLKRFKSNLGADEFQKTTISLRLP